MQHADDGDRNRTAAFKFNYGLINFGFNVFTGDPGLDFDNDRKYITSKNGTKTYILGNQGENPDEYRAGVLFIGYGPLQVGWDSELNRHLVQNKFAHDFLTGGTSPHFAWVSRKSKFYFNFGSDSGIGNW